MGESFDFVILGAGAMGSILGAHLARAGHSAAIIARGRRAEQFRNDGLRITGLDHFDARISVIDDPAALREARVLTVATKAIGTAESLKPLARVKIGYALSVQNGVLKDDLLAAALGPDHDLGALANMSGELVASGEVLFTRNVSLQIGALRPRGCRPVPRRASMPLRATPRPATTATCAASLKFFRAESPRRDPCLARDGECDSGPHLAERIHAPSAADQTVARVRHVVLAGNIDEYIRAARTA